MKKTVTCQYAGKLFWPHSPNHPLTQLPGHLAMCSKCIISVDLDLNGSFMHQRRVLGDVLNILYLRMFNTNFTIYLHIKAAFSVFKYKFVSMDLCVCVFVFAMQFLHIHLHFYAIYATTQIKMQTCTRTRTYCIKYMKCIKIEGI